MVTIARDIIVSLAAIVTAFVGLRGLGTWRRQLRGNTEYQLAKSMLVSVYELREAIASVRYPLMQYSREPDFPQEKLKELSQREREWHAFDQAYQRRWEPVPTAKAKLDANVLEAEAVWGPEIRAKFSQLNPLIVKLRCAIQDHLEARNPNVHYEGPGPELDKEFRETLYWGGETDSFKQQLEDVIRGIENELRPHIIQHHR